MEFPLWPSVLDLETDENTARAFLADTGLVVVEMSAIERENMVLKARIAELSGGAA